MNKWCIRVYSSWKLSVIAVASALVCLPLFSQSEEDNDEEEIFELTPFTVDGSANVGYRATSSLGGTRIRTDLGATVGGAQDIRLTRDLVALGLIPPSASFTPEGLFSEHDLPIGGQAQPGFLIDLAAQAAPFHSVAQPEVEMLAQLGFISGIDATTFQRPPLNLVAVVDKSGSMSGQPLDLVRRSLSQILSQLGNGDQLSIVLYGSSTYLHLPPTSTVAANRESIQAAIDAIACSGSTYMEAGLSLGYETARSSAKTFEGFTRVMLFTDEQPNVGRTDATSFMSLAEGAALEGIGLTTIGVGTHFGAELAEKISSVRGGNLFFFADANAMEETFRKEFDTMVFELAYDMELTITPEPGAKIVGLYGLPGDMVQWHETGSLSLGIATLFASRNKGAIYVGLAASDGQPDLAHQGPEKSLATISVSYIQADNKAERLSTLALTLTPPAQRMEGLLKGQYLVDQYASFKLATLLYEKGEYNAATEIAQAFARQALPLKDSKLQKERALAQDFAQRLDEDRRQRGLSSLETKPATVRGKSALIGEWIEIIPTETSDARAIIRFNDNGQAELYTSSDAHPLRFVDESSFAATWRKIVFADWAQSVRYRMKGDTLQITDAENVTTYLRRPTQAELDRAVTLRALQREVSGLASASTADVALAR